MMAFLALGCIALAVKLVQLGAILRVDGIATIVAAWYCWRADRLGRALLAHRATGVKEQS